MAFGESKGAHLPPPQVTGSKRGIGEPRFDDIQPSKPTVGADTGESLMGYLLGDKIAPMTENAYRNQSPLWYRIQEGWLSPKEIAHFNKDTSQLSSTEIADFEAKYHN